MKPWYAKWLLPPDEYRAAVERMARWLRAETDGGDPYRDPADHLFMADRFDRDVKALAAAELARHATLYLSEGDPCRRPPATPTP